MLHEHGHAQLAAFTTTSYLQRVTEVTPGVWHVLGLGHANAIFVEGRTGVVLIDTLDTLERGRQLRQIITEKTGKTVQTILYTHGHPDHRGGAGAFTEHTATPPEIIAFAPARPPLEYTERLQDIQNLRGGRQFGYPLSDAENISQGIGIREGITRGEHRAFVPPTTVYDQDHVVRDIDGIHLELTRLPGEADEQMAVWLPEHKALCTGDNFYGCWPNLYAIRGSQYRDIAVWLHSLDTLLHWPAEHLLPGHTRHISGREEIVAVLGSFRDAIRYVLDATLAGMNEGKTADELAASITLPEQLASLPWLGEYYGSVDWTVRAIFSAYLGWFDGNPTRLHPLPPAEHARKTMAMMGGATPVLTAAHKAEADGDTQWCLELCDILLQAGQETAAARSLKARALRHLAEYETSANGRHYYLVCAHECEA